jgi:GNAT superfamily N-acetyltransferase
MTATAAAAGVTVREARAGDGDALLALARACPMRGDITLRVEREPDFFTMDRLLGDPWQVAVAARGDVVVGCIAMAARETYLHGRPARTTYVGDLKVHPAHRDGAAADALIRHASAWCGDHGGMHVPMLFTILSGNRRMERRIPGVRGLPAFTRFATLRAYTAPLPRRRAVRAAAWRVAPATSRDIDEMITLWQRVASQRNFARLFDEQRLLHWLGEAPGLGVSDYLVARRPDGRIAGFLAVWDTSALHTLRVLRYSHRLAAFLVLHNAVAPLLGGAALPVRGAPLRTCTALHVCVPPGEPAVLHALLVRAMELARTARCTAFTVGLDVRDPLTVALHGLLGQPATVHAYVTSPSGRYDGPPLDDFPLHHEVALI